MHVLIGGYTKKTSKGIYEFDLIGKNAQAHLENIRNIVNISGPTYFKVDKNLLFSIAKTDSEGGIVSYMLNDDHAQKIDQILMTGSSPAYLGINKQANLLYSANYHTGIVCVYRYDNEGHLTLLDSLQHTNKTLGPKKEQDSAHPHYFDVTPAGNLVVCDLGNDSLTFYKLNDNDKLEKLADYQMPAGFGPRHLVFAANRPYMFVVGELSSSVAVINYDESNWNFNLIHRYSTIPANFSSHNGAAAIRISNDNRFLYVSNRGHNSICVFKIESDFSLSLAQRISTFGDFPRDFNWDESEKYVVVANQESDNATLYIRNAETGYLSVIQQDISVPEGTCVLFF